MTEPNPRIDGVRQQGCAVDDDRTLVTAIAVDLMSASIWLVHRDGQAERIGKTPAGCPKIDSAFPRAFGDGTARLCMGQADVGGGGATTHHTWIDFPDAFVPAPDAPAGSGGGAAFVFAPNGSLQVFAKADVTGPVTIDLDAFGVHASALSVELVVSGEPKRVAHVENGLSCTVQAPGTRNMASGVIAPGVGNTLTVTTQGGALAELHINILGWWE